MTISPNFDYFAENYCLGVSQLVSLRLVADLETPVSAMLKLKTGSNYCFLLESVEGGATRGRYSIIGLNPDIIWKLENGKVFINRDVIRNGQEKFEEIDRDPLTALRELLAESYIEADENLPPMAAGIFGYLGYDVVREMEDLPAIKTNELEIADAMLIRPTLLAIFDNVRDEIILVTPAYRQENVSAKSSYKKACDLIAEAVGALDRPLEHHKRAENDIAPLKSPHSNMSAEEFHAMIGKGKEYIAAGDIFQVVLSQRFEADFSLPHFALYRSLRRINPSPFLYYLNFDQFSLIGSSPEILVRVRDGKVTLRPLAGTRRRGSTALEDRALAKELLEDPKERAEHLMLLDLGRNDVGRVGAIGTVKVTEQFSVEYYSQVMHIVSNIEAQLSAGKDVIDALVAGFPAGTVSGAPKIRAMEIIDELEKSKRGTYAGCVGYFSANGDMDTCIALRTAIVKNGKMYVQAGCGIVADSVPEAEYEESVNKAKALFRAAEEAMFFSGRERGGRVS